MSQTQQGGPYPQSVATEEVINFGLGQPSPSLLPLNLIARGANQLAGEDPLLLQYGRGSGPRPFLEALAGFLTAGYGSTVTADDLAVTAGTSMALGLVSQILARSGDRVVCGDPTYFLAHGVFASQGLRAVGVPVDDGGLDTDALEALLDSDGPIAFVYCIPSFQNPSGTCLRPERARRLVELAERYDFVIVADEPYLLLPFEAAPPCLMSYDEGRGRVLSLGTFSKILAPGLRLGWIHAHPALIARFLNHGVLRSGGSLNPIVTRIVQTTLEDGSLTENISMLRQVLKNRSIRLSRALDAAGLRHQPPRGGYFTWVDLGMGADSTSLLEHCRTQHGVAFCPGERCAVSEELRRYVRLSFAFYTEEELEEGVDRLVQGLRGSETGK